MKNLFSAATLAVLFSVFVVTNARAADAVKSKSTPVTRSNVSNNKTVSDPKDEDCDGRTDAPDCVKGSKANKDYATDPYVETTQRDQASGLATGKRMHKPVTIATEVDKSTPVSAADSSASVTTSAVKPASSEGCCPGRCCPPDAQDHAINTKGTGTGGITASDQASERVLPTVNKKTDVATGDGVDSTNGEAAKSTPQLYKATQGKTGSTK